MRDLRDRWFQIDSPWGTHRVALWHTLQLVGGPILEFGMGPQSTPYLREFAEVTGRSLTSVETNPEFCDEGGVLLDSYEEFYDRFRLSFGVALVDHGPVLRRRFDVARLRDCVTTLVIHDSNIRCYRLAEVWPHFPYRVDHKQPEERWTTVVSKTRSLEDLRCVLES